MDSRNGGTPTILVIFGVTGDLMQRKITPALLRLSRAKQLPEHFRVVGVSRRELDDQGLRVHLGLEGDEEDFQNLFFYHHGAFGKEASYHDLAKRLKAIDDEWGICSNKLFYLAVPPELYEMIVGNLASAKLTVPCGDLNEGWTRVLIEKPFGKDLKSAKRLDALLAELFDESQIYRIDHYLAKESLQNILAFRFGNDFFESQWNKEHISQITVRFLETLGVESRGEFYDGVGALRDVGQNHLLQMLALVVMERPSNFTLEEIRTKRADALKFLVPPSEGEISLRTRRGQYVGYREVRGVASDSETETYFRIETTLKKSQLEGVPIIIEAGKKMKENRKEVELVFGRNTLTIHLEPKEGITLGFLAKKSGNTMELEERALEFNFHKSDERFGEYEKLFLDAIQGDQTLFVSSEEVAAMWRFVDPILEGWAKELVPLERYA